MTVIAIVIIGAVLAIGFVFAVARLFWPAGSRAEEEDITGSTAVPFDGGDGHGGFH
jgi:hypothetical protein